MPKNRKNLFDKTNKNFLNMKELSYLVVYNITKHMFVILIARRLILDKKFFELGE